MRRAFIILALSFALPHFAEAQMTITKYVPKYIYVQPELDCYEHMIVDVIADKVIKIVHGGKIQKNLYEDFAVALKRWEQEGWKIKGAPAVTIEKWGIEKEKYVFYREVYKPGEIDKKKRP